MSFEQLIAKVEQAERALEAQERRAAADFRQLKSSWREAWTPWRIVVAGAVFLGQWGPAQPPTVVVDGDTEPLPPYYHLLLVPFLIMWIGALALSRRGVARFLSTRALVLGGFVSYSLYMTHLVWFGLWRAGMRARRSEPRASRPPGRPR